MPTATTMNAQTTSSPPFFDPTRPLNVTIEQVCAMLPASRAHVNRLIKSGTLTHLKMGKRVLIPLQAVYDYVDSLKVN